MKKRKRILSGTEEMPMSTMIDVVFLLLIYFIVTQKPIIEETLLQVDIPDKSPGKVEGIPLQIGVFREKGDYYRVSGRPWKRTALFSYLNDISQNDPEQPLIINCGPDAKHKKLIDLLDACADAELTNLNILNIDR